MTKLGDGCREPWGTIGPTGRLFGEKKREKQYFMGRLKAGQEKENGRTPLEKKKEILVL